MMLAFEDVAITITGRQTTPFPKVNIGSERSIKNTIKRVDRWLIENALAEAEARGDDYNATIFREKIHNLQQADKDHAYSYLFLK